LAMLPRGAIVHPLRAQVDARNEDRGSNNQKFLALFPAQGSYPRYRQNYSGTARVSIGGVSLAERRYWVVAWAVEATHGLYGRIVRGPCSSPADGARRVSYQA
jgi:hypothetical protein